MLCTAPLSERDAIVDTALEIPGVVNVRVILSGVENVRVVATGRSRADIADVERSLHELGLEVAHTRMIRSESSRTFNHPEG